jgi:hypothetical protein
MVNTIFFYWDGYLDDLSPRRKMLNDCIYSTRIFNPNHTIIVVSNTLKEKEFDPKYNILVRTWDLSLFDDIPIPKSLIEEHYINVNPRERSDLIRMVLLYKYGGSYMDTDDLAIKPINQTKENLVCRNYDPHTAHYNNLTPEDCIKGTHREIPGYDHLNIMPRNDCWLNFNPKSKFIYSILSNPKIVEANKAIYIGDNTSWQSLTLEACKSNKIKIDYNLGLTLLYLYEDFVSASSIWDRCHHGGEMCDIWKKLPDMDNYSWGFYKCDKETAISFYREIYDKYPYVSHMWLHSKDMKEEWLIDELDESQKYSVSTWIYDNIKKQINK